MPPAEYIYCNNTTTVASYIVALSLGIDVYVALAVVCCVCEQRISVELSYAVLRDDLDMLFYVVI